MNSRWIAAWIVCLLSSLFAPSLTAVAAEHTADSLEMVKDRLAQKEALLIDVREQKEWDQGHLRGAMSVPLSLLRSGADAKEFPDVLAQQLSKDKIIYAHCASGMRCLLAADLLKKMGYDVRPLKAGYQDLIEAGFSKAK